jgi:hypothetical protein
VTLPALYLVIISVNLHGGIYLGAYRLSRNCFSLFKECVLSRMLQETRSTRRRRHCR